MRLVVKDEGEFFPWYLTMEIDGKEQEFNGTGATVGHAVDMAKRACLDRKQDPKEMKIEYV